MATLQPTDPNSHAWVAAPAPAASLPGYLAYVALFNGDDGEGKVSISLAQAGVDPSASVCARDLWTRTDLPGKLSGGGDFGAALPPHGAGLFAILQC